MLQVEEGEWSKKGGGRRRVVVEEGGDWRRGWSMKKKGVRMDILNSLVILIQFVYWLFLFWLSFYFDLYFDLNILYILNFYYFSFSIYF